MQEYFDVKTGTLYLSKLLEQQAKPEVVKADMDSKSTPKLRRTLALMDVNQSPIYFSNERQSLVYGAFDLSDQSNKDLVRVTQLITADGTVVSPVELRDFENALTQSSEESQNRMTF